MDLNSTKLKAAFMALLANYRGDIDDIADFENRFCVRCCPFARLHTGNEICPAMTQCEEDGVLTDDYEIDDAKCNEAILNWYMEHSTDD